jgi:type IV pilus assembly protein PilM
MLERSFLGIDLGSYAIKLVEYRRGLRDGRFTHCSEVLLPPKASAEDVAVLLAQALAERELSRDCIVTALPGTRVTQRHFRLPFTGRQVAGAVRFEVEESLPVPLERMILTHEVVGVRDGQTDVLAILAPRTDIEEHLAVVRRCGLEPRHVEAEGAVLANLSPYLGAGDTARVVLDIGHSKTHVGLLAGGKPLLLRAIPIAGDRFTEAIAEELALGREDAEEYKHEHGIFKLGTTTPTSLRLGVLLDQLARETLRTLQSLVSDAVNPVAPAEVVLVGGSAAIRELPDYLSERLGLPCRTLTVADGAAGAGPLADGRAAVFAQAAALALRGSSARSTQFDFRQEEFRFVPDLSALWPQVQWTGVWLAVLLLLWPISVGSSLFGVSRQASRFQGEIDRVQREIFPDALPTDDPMASFMTRYRDTKALADHLGVTGSGASPLEMLRQISSGIPASLDVTLSELRIEQKGIRARGIAPDAAAANQVEQLLRQIEIFRSVTIGDLKRENEGGFSFNLTIDLGD